MFKDISNTAFSRNTLISLWIVALSLPIAAQNAAISGDCKQGGTKATVSGLASSNYLQGIVPYCTVTVYLTGTTNLATIYSNVTGTPLTNPFTANSNGAWTFFTVINQGYDVVMSGGYSPNIYQAPVTLVGLFPSTQIITTAGNPAAPAFTVQLANSTVTNFQADPSITINPTSHTLATPSIVMGGPINDVRFYGAVADGVSDASLGIQEAINSCPLAQANLITGLVSNARVALGCEVRIPSSATGTSYSIQHVVWLTQRWNVSFTSSGSTVTVTPSGCVTGCSPGQGAATTIPGILPGVLFTVLAPSDSTYNQAAATVASGTGAGFTYTQTSSGTPTTGQVVVAHSVWLHGDGINNTYIVNSTGTNWWLAYDAGQYNGWFSGITSVGGGIINHTALQAEPATFVAGPGLKGTFVVRDSQFLNAPFYAIYTPEENGEGGSGWFNHVIENVLFSNNCGAVGLFQPNSNAGYNYHNRLWRNTCPAPFSTASPITNIAVTSGSPYNILTVTQANNYAGTSNITNVTFSGNVAIVTANNNYAAGDCGQFSNLAGTSAVTAMNSQRLCVISAGLSSTQFEVNWTSTGTFAQTTALFQATATLANIPSANAALAGNYIVTSATPTQWTAVTSQPTQTISSPSSGSSVDTTLLAVDFMDNSSNEVYRENDEEVHDLSTTASLPYYEISPNANLSSTAHCQVTIENERFGSEVSSPDAPPQDFITFGPLVPQPVAISGCSGNLLRDNYFQALFQGNPLSEVNAVVQNVALNGSTIEGNYFGTLPGGGFSGAIIADNWQRFDTGELSNALSYENYTDLDSAFRRKTSNLQGILFGYQTASGTWTAGGGNGWNPILADDPNRAVTNLLASAVLTSWTATNATVTQNLVGPDGQSTSGFTVTTTATGTLAGINSSFSATGPGYFNCSLYVKGISQNAVQILVSGSISYSSPSWFQQVSPTSWTRLNVPFYLSDNTPHTIEFYLRPNQNGIEGSVGASYPVCVSGNTPPSEGLNPPAALDYRNLVPDSAIKLGSAYWTVVSGSMPVVNAAAPSGGNAFVYTGTGSPSGTIYQKSSTISVTPGVTYTLSGCIGNTNGAGSPNPFWAVYNTSVTTQYAVMTEPGGSASCTGGSGRISTSFTIPGGVTQVVVIADTANTTVASGQSLIFSDPQLETGAIAHNYATNNLDDVTGNVPLTALPAQTANTVLGATSATTPSGISIPSCSGASNALTWTSGTGFGCNTISGITTPRIASGGCSGTATSSFTGMLFNLGSTGSTCAAAAGTPVNGITIPNGYSGTVSHLTVRCQTTGVNSSSGVFTIYDTAVGTSTNSATPVTVTYGTTTANAIVADSTHTYSPNAGDILSVRYTTQASETLANCSASFEY